MQEYIVNGLLLVVALLAAGPSGPRHADPPPA